MGIGLYGPPIPGAPWLRQSRRASLRSRGERTRVGPGLLARVRDRDDAQRLRRTVDQIVVILNSLLSGGFITRTGLESYEIERFPVDGLTGTFPP